MRLCCDTFEAEKTRRDTFCKEIKWNNFTWNREKFETRSSSEDNSIAKYSKIKEKFSLNSYNGMIWRTERKDKFPFRKARQHVYGKEIILGGGEGGKTGKKFGKLIESTKRKGGWSTTGLGFNLTTRDKSWRGGPSTSLKALGVGIARARLRLFLHLFGQIYGRAFIMKIDISSGGAGPFDGVSCPPTETNKINFRVH